MLQTKLMLRLNTCALVGEDFLKAMEELIKELNMTVGVYYKI